MTSTLVHFDPNLYYQKHKILMTLNFICNNVSYHIISQLFWSLLEVMLAMSCQFWFLSTVISDAIFYLFFGLGI